MNREWVQKTDWKNLLPDATNVALTTWLIMQKQTKIIS